MMYSLLTPPAMEPLRLDEVKAALRIGHDDDDMLLSGMISTARTYLERRLDKAFLRQTWQCRHEGAFQGPVPLRPAGRIDVQSVNITDGEGVTTPLEADDWRLFGERPRQIEVALPAGIASPFHTDIVFEAGDEELSDIPADLLRALYMLTAHYYEERELYRQQRYVSVPLGVEALIEAYREVRL